MKQIPFVEMEPHYDHKRKIQAKHVMRKKVVTVRSVEKASYIIKILENCHHNGFPVTDQSDHGFKGIILRSTMITLLNEQLGFKYESDKSDPYKSVINYLKNCHGD